jgi:uncharacterized protein YnzC (UPF0291/DUF896 family)
MDQKDIDRINELYHKYKAGSITEEEAEERARLRKEYVEALRRNLRASLDSTKIQYPDGRLESLKSRAENIKARR